MRSLFILGYLLLCFNNTFIASAQPFNWVVQLGSKYTDAPTQLIGDAQNNLYLTANFRDTLITDQGNTISRGEYDGIVAKYNSNGERLWLTQIGGEGFDELHHIAADGAGNTYAAGFTNDTIVVQTDTVRINQANSSQLFITRLNASGIPQWIRSIGSNFGTVGISGFAVDGQGNSYIGGYFQDTIVWNTDTIVANSGADGFLAKYNSSGVLQWQRPITGNASEVVRHISLDAAGNVWVVGSFNDKLLLDSNVLTATEGTFDTFLAQYNTNGELIWAKQLFTHDLIADRLASATNGGAYISGTAYATTTIDNTATIDEAGNGEIFVAYLDANGALVWAKGYDATPQLQYIQQLTVAANGDLYATGKFAYQLAFGNATLVTTDQSQACVLHFGSAGNEISALQYAASMGVATALDSNGSCYTTGYFLGEATIGNNNLTSWGMYDVVLAKINDDFINASNNVVAPHRVLQIAPNPAQSYLQISDDGNGNNDYCYVLSDLSGRVITQTNSHYLNVQDIARGMYLLTQYERGMQVAVAKLILQ